jgi:hypothetical protein
MIEDPDSATACPASSAAQTLTGVQNGFGAHSSTA